MSGQGRQPGAEGTRKRAGREQQHPHGRRGRLDALLLPALLLAALALLPALFAGGCERGAPPPAGPVVFSGAEGAGSEYVGAAACKECHEEIYNGWRATFHAYKFQQASPAFIIGDFTTHNTFRDGDNAATMSREGDAFYVTTGGEGQDARRFRVDYVVGSVWKQRYITRDESGAMFVLPVQWNVRTRQWVGYQALEGGGEDAPEGGWLASGQAFQFRCMGCHTTNSQVTQQAQGRTQTSWTDLGVACEACHGPGGAHLRAPIHNKAATIINPAKMADPERAAAICGACHTRGSGTKPPYAWPVGFRPGDVLQFSFDAQPGAYPDGSPREHHQQFNDWQASGHARAGVMCWDCHSTHATGKSNRFQLKLPGSVLCATCHQVEPRGVHGLHSVNNCMGCHMPKTIQSATPGDLRSHRFVVVRPSLTVEAGDVKEQPNSCNLCHYHKDTDPERLQHFMLAAKKPQFCRTCHYHAEQDPEDQEQ